MTDKPVSITGVPAASNLGQWSWAVFEWARNPYVILITIYIFSPYFTSVVVGDPVKGQALWGSINGYAGLIIALLAPLLGAIADAGGRRKPWIAVWLCVLVPSSWFLWYALPNGAGLSVPVVSVLLGLNAVVFVFTQPFHNAMLPSIAPHDRLGFLSGLGLALGNAGALLILIFMMVAFTLPGSVDWSFVPAKPLFGLDPAQHENSRIAGPIVAVWLVLFAMPLMLFTPDRAPGNASWGSAIRGGFGSLWRTLKSLRHYRNIAIYLAACMIFTDGQTAVLVFGGVYPVGAFGWNALSTLIFGISLSAFAVFGGFLGGWLDDKLGSKRALLIELCGTMLGLLGDVSITPHQLFFVIPWDPATAGQVWSLPFFSTVPELLYFAMATLVAVFITAAYASSRTMLARIAPPEKMTEFFGLFSLSGYATTWMSSFAVGFFTIAFASQRAGYASILIFLGIGFVLMCFVREERVSAES